MHTGINLQPGQVLVITVNKKETWRAGSGPRTSNANGLGNPLGYNFGTFKKSGFSFLYSLVGSIDNGRTFFPVGTQLKMTILSYGSLSLYYWDSNKEDNSGYVTATIHLY
jgi:hypothetical protein